MNILVVDDEKNQIESLRRGLRSRGYQVVEALSANEALEILKEEGDEIDMVITDYFMEEMNGLELLKNIRENYSNLPVILITAYGDKEIVIDALQNRCDGFIEKPFVLDDLLTEIDRAKMNIIQNITSSRLSKIIPILVHQINNPLMSIMGSAELAMLSLRDEDAIKNYINNIIESTEEISQINQEMLHPRRYSDVKTEPVDLRKVLDGCLETFADLCNLKGISVSKHLDALDVRVPGNKFDLKQIFKNLILNAIDSMDGRPQKLLEVGASLDSMPSSISIYIKDTGCGIDDKLKGKLFSQYFTTKKYGIGLGLHIVKSILDAHEGTIEVDTETDKGTTFALKLPVINDYN